MDFSRPITSVIPGVQGKLLDAIACLGRSVTSGQAASIAKVSENQASKILRELATLGILDRTDAGNAALYQLSPTNVAASVVRDLCELRYRLFEKIRELSAPMVHEEPNIWIAVFGSTARGDSTSASDIDLMVVRPDLINSPDRREVWDRLVFEFSQSIASFAGNPVNPVEYWRSEVDPSRPFWKEVLRDSFTITGTAPITSRSEQLVRHGAILTHERGNAPSKERKPLGSNKARSF
jgi:predicted nucleotidyltransferase